MPVIQLDDLLREYDAPQAMIASSSNGHAAAPVESHTPSRLPHRSATNKRQHDDNYNKLLECEIKKLRVETRKFELERGVLKLEEKLLQKQLGRFNLV